jgi:hypothetical protein
MIFRVPADGAEVWWFSLRLFMRWQLSGKFPKNSEKNDFSGDFFSDRVTKTLFLCHSSYPSRHFLAI